MNIFYLLFSNISLIIILLWFFLFIYLGIKVFKKKFSIIEKRFISSKVTTNSNFDYKKIFYLILLMFLLTQTGANSSFICYVNISSATNAEWKGYQTFIFLKIIISFFTLFSFYSFIFLFFVTGDSKKKEYSWKLIIFIILFINLLFNLILIPQQLLFLASYNLLTFSQAINYLIIFFLYILTLHFFLNLSKYFFNYTISEFFKLTLVVFKYQTIKEIFIKKNKINLLNFFQQFLGLSQLVDETQKYYFVTEDICFVVPAVNSYQYSDQQVTIKNLSFTMINHQTICHNKTLKDYIFINGWKMSLIQ